MPKNMKHSLSELPAIVLTLESGKGSDYLLCQLTADKELSVFERLPAELLEPILEEVHLNSISGLRGLACVSRTCRALASPYFFKRLECEFKELVQNYRWGSPPVIVLGATDNFKTLKFHLEPQPGGGRPVTITQVLEVENTFECLEYLPKESEFFRLPPPALDLLSRTLPLLSKLVIDLKDFTGYSPSWDKAYNEARRNRRMEPLQYTDGLDIVCAIARFQNLRHLTLHFKLCRTEIFLMHPNPGCRAVWEVFDSIYGRKQGQHLVQFGVVFRAHSKSIFGRVDYSFKFDQSMVSTTMEIKRSDVISSKGDMQSQWKCTCDNPVYGKVIERLKRFEKIYGEPASWRLGSTQHNILYGRYSSLPWSIIMESLMRLALFPSYFVFEDGKRMQFEPSLADVEVTCQKDFWRPRARLREWLFHKLIS